MFRRFGRAVIIGALAAAGFIAFGSPALAVDSDGVGEVAVPVVDSQSDEGCREPIADPAEGSGPYPSAAYEQQVFDHGACLFAKGVAELASASVLGVPAAVLDYGEEIATFGSAYPLGVN